jgi:cbb3-type cytochrome oxidase maturation protein
MDTLSYLILLSLALGLGAWLFFLWSVKSGQYDDVERPKHRMLDEDEEAEGTEHRDDTEDRE